MTVAIISSGAWRRMLALVLLGLGLAITAKGAAVAEGTVENEAAAALMAAAAGQQQAASREAPLPLHMTPAAADWESEGVEGGDPLAALRGLLDGLGEEEGDSADFAGLDAENGLIRAALSGALNKNFFSAGMGLDRLLRSISPQEADDVFTLFPPVQKMPAWQAFLAQGSSSSSSNDAEAEAAAKAGAVQELGKAMGVLATLGSSPESVMEAVRGFTTDAAQQEDPELQLLMEELVNPSDAAAGATAMERIQERFLQRTLGAASTLTMADFTDTTWLEAAREGLLGNADIVRLIGDDRMLSILANPSMVPRLASQFPDPEALLSSW